VHGNRRRDGLFIRKRELFKYLDISSPVDGSIDEIYLLNGISAT
jgi:hypothetical protein